MLPNYRVLVALHLAADVAGLIGQARHITNMMGGSKHFPTPSPSLAVVDKAADDLDDAEITAKTRVRGAVAGRNAKRAVLVALLYGLKGYVQSVADAADP